MAAASTSSDSGFLRRLLDSRRRISTQLYLAIGGAVTLTIAASLIGWMSLNIVEGAQTRVNERSVPQLTSAFGIAQHGGNLVAAAPRMTAAETPEELDAVYQNIGEELWVFGGCGWTRSEARSLGKTLTPKSSPECAPTPTG